MPTSESTPSSSLQLQSTLNRDGVLTIELADATVPAPGRDDVVVRIDAAPINPSDLLSLTASADLSNAEFGGSSDRPWVRARLSAAGTKARAGRFGVPMTIGLEGAGVVVAAGANAAAMVGRKVAVLTLARGTLAQYVTVPSAACVPIPEPFTTRECSALFVNPLTALAIAETVRLAGQSALLQTAAASNLGQMLLKICQEDDLKIVNIVRRPQQAALLRDMGARYVCDSSAPAFTEDLIRAIQETGASMAFDAIGGGTMANQMMLAMEAAAVSRLTDYSPYGSLEPKKVYIYGHLDPAPLQVMHEDYGLLWSIEGWVMPAIMERIGPARSEALRQRALTGVRTTFASRFTQDISLAEALRRDTMLGYCKQATGEKFLIRPNG
jgi:NADPH:quinone reductase